MLAFDTQLFMEKYFNKVLFSIAALLLISVNFFPLKGDLIEEIDAGTVIKIEEVPTSWNSRRRTLVETEKAILYVKGIISIIKGVSARIDKYDSGKQYLCLSDRDNCLPIINET